MQQMVENPPVGPLPALSAGLPLVGWAQMHLCKWRMKRALRDWWGLSCTRGDVVIGREERGSLEHLQDSVHFCCSHAASSTVPFWPLLFWDRKSGWEERIPGFRKQVGLQRKARETSRREIFVNFHKDISLANCWLTGYTHDLIRGSETASFKCQMYGKTPRCRSWNSLRHLVPLCETGSCTFGLIPWGSSYILM